MTDMRTAQKATLAAIPEDTHGSISKRNAELDGVSVTQVTFHVGARWSNDLKDRAQTEFCELPHGIQCRRCDDASSSA